MQNLANCRTPGRWSTCASGAPVESLEIQRIRGTNDVLAPLSLAYQQVADHWRRLFGLYGYDLIDTPVLEPTESFVGYH